MSNRQSTKKEGLGFKNNNPTVSKIKSLTKEKLTSRKVDGDEVIKDEKSKVDRNKNKEVVMDEE